MFNMFVDILPAHENEDMHKKVGVDKFLSGHFHLADDSFAARYRTRILNQLQ